MGNLQVAESDHRKALELKKKIYGPDALTVGASLRNLARLVALRNPAEGEKLFQEAVDLYVKDPKAPPSTTRARYSGWQKPREIEGISRRRARHCNMPQICVEESGTKHPLYAAVLRDQG